LVLVPEIDASSGTIAAYRHGIMAGVKGRRWRKTRNTHNPATSTKVVTASPITATVIE
jgi:hypothetical protein